MWICKRQQNQMLMPVYVRAARRFCARFVCCSCFRAGDQGEQDHGNQKCERAEPLRNRQRAPNNSLNIATQEFDKVQAKRIARCQHKNRNSVRELIPLDELQQAEEKNRQKALV